MDERSALVSTPVINLKRFLYQNLLHSIVRLSNWRRCQAYLYVVGIEGGRLVAPLYLLTTRLNKTQSMDPNLPAMPYVPVSHPPVLSHFKLTVHFPGA